MLLWRVALSLILTRATSYIGYTFVLSSLELCLCGPHLQELADVERRLHSAEARHNDLAVKLPEATQPLIRQMESMRASAAAQADAWAALEATLKDRAQDAEARAESATARAEMADACAESAIVRLSEAMAVAQQAQKAAAVAEGQREAEAERFRVVQETLDALQQERAVLLEQVAALREELQQVCSIDWRQCAFAHMSMCDTRNWYNWCLALCPDHSIEWVYMTNVHGGC